MLPGKINSRRGEFFGEADLKIYKPLEDDPTTKSSQYRNIFIPDSNYKKKYGNEFHIKDIINEMWQTYWEYSDDNFLTEIKKDFNQRIFEIYLSYYFLKRNIKLLKKEKDVGAPDIEFMLNSNRIRIECVTPTNGNEGKEDSLVDFANSKKIITHDVQADKMIFRFKNVLMKKKEKFETVYKQGINESINIIAISGSELYEKYSDNFDCPFILKSLYPVGNLTLKINSGKVEELYEEDETINKSSGEPVSKDFFMNKDNKNISGVIYSFLDIWNIGNLENAGNDLIYIENINANIKFDPSIIGIKRQPIPSMGNGFLKF